jgi:hypothetical protein
MAEKTPAWQSYKGTKRVLAEMRALQKSLSSKVGGLGGCPQQRAEHALLFAKASSCLQAGKHARPRLHDLKMPDENDCMTWQLRVRWVGCNTWQT